MSSVIGSINIRKAVSMSNQRYCFFDLPECLNIYVYKNTSIAAMHVIVRVFCFVGLQTPEADSKAAESL